jgi:phosphomannomutase/phosphoglucomutase
MKATPNKSWLPQLIALFKRSPLAAWLGGCLFAATIMCAAITFYLWSTLVVSEQQQQFREFTQQNLNKATSNVNGHLLSLRKKVAFFGQSPKLIDALSNNDELQLRAIRLNIKSNFPQAEGVRLIPLGQAKLDLDAELPLRFSDLEMIKQTEARLEMEPEAVKLPQGWRLNFALPIPTDPQQPVAGTLLITATLDSTFKAMVEGLENAGRFSFLQNFSGGQHRIYSSGEGTELEQSVTGEISGTPWAIEYIPSTSVSQAIQTNWLIFAISTSIVWLTIFVIAAAIGIYVGRKEERQNNAIAKTYQRMGQTSHHSPLGTTAYSNLTTDILDIDIDNEENLLGFDDAPNAAEPQKEQSHSPKTAINQVPAHIFRAYDIRGLAETDITKEVAQFIGQALGSEALDLGESALIVGRDARTHSPLLTEYLVRGILSTGCNVINIGTVPTPIVYFATETLEGHKSGVVVTASHNDAEYNGFKIIMQGRTRTDKDIQVIKDRIEQGRFYSGEGEEKRHEIINDYLDTIIADVALAGDVSMVIDAGNGVTGKVAPKLFEELGCDITCINCDLDGTFPNHGPDPSKPNNLKQLIEKVAEIGADFGVAFDGDGDRLVVVTKTGQIIWPDRLLMLFAKDILARNPGADVVYDVKCTRSINRVVTQFGGRPIMWKTGHAPMKAKVTETGALLGGEYSGHIFIKERWFGFDDGMYVAARLAEILSLAGDTLDNIFEEFPELPSTLEILVPANETQKFEVIKTLTETADFKDAKITTLDGIRIDFPHGWGIVRASNTSPNLTLRAEAQTQAELHDIKALLTRELRKIDTTLTPKW